ncbi:ribosomal protein L6 [Schizophyllum commune Loenen D]|nr:ribosomal protein L6 [Schizophyllum commune Loenen D]
MQALPRGPLAHCAARRFSTSAVARVRLPHIGREPLLWKDPVKLTPTPESILVEGPLGRTAVPLKPYITLHFPDPNQLQIGVKDMGEREQRMMWGTTRTLIANAIVGMTEGYSVPLYLVGVGFRANMEDDPRGTLDGGSGKRLHMKLGYTHSVYVPIPPYMKAEVPSATKISLFCTDKQLLGEFARKIKSLRMPEPYKGKGIFIGKETIRLKSAKKR